MTDEIQKITKDTVKNLLPMRAQDSNKGTFGKVLNIAGSLNYQGAAFLSSVSPLKVGAGLVTLASIETVINNLASSAPWITFFQLRDYYKKCIASDAFLEIKDTLDTYNVISVGPGLSDMPAVSAFVDDLVRYLNTTDKKVVIDADALNVLAKSETKKLPKNAVITPHPMELSRLLGETVDVIQSDRIKYAKQAVQKFGCNVVLKGSKTVVALRNGNTYENTSGNSSLAKAGSGDVLTGMISGFCAQGLTVDDASLLGVYLHGVCGEIASCELTQYCVLATNLIDSIPQAIKILTGEADA